MLSLSREQWMPDTALFLAFIATVVLLVAVPGPNVAVIVATSFAQGRRYGLITVAGTSSAMVVQLSLTVMGTLTVLTALAEVFELLRWFGVAYLVYLGVRLWAEDVQPPMATTKPMSAPEVYLRGFLVSLANPKTLLFYAALLPQFISSAADPKMQLLILSGTFLMIATGLDSVWALMAARVRRLVTGKMRLTNRVAGVLLIAAGIGLAMARKP